MARAFKIFLTLAAIGLAVAGGYQAYQSYASAGTTTNFRTVQVERGELLVAVGATGTLEPEDLVDIGAQVVGRVKELGVDARGETDPRYAGEAIDYGAQVKQGQTLALIDESVYLAQRNQAKASLDRAKADLLQLEAKRKQTEAEWLRAQKLRSLKVSGLALGRQKSGEGSIQIQGISDADFVLARANFEAAKANIEVGKASIDQSDAALQLAETNLSYTVIASPVDGTVIDRRVNIGQTVVSSLNAPSLFLIAKDLRKMQVWASVNEADIGLIKIDMPVRFTVDAFPDDVFEGKVVQVRLNATMTQNVVTYTVVIANDNSDLKLLPYLTADVKFVVRSYEDALLVPNAALRYRPRPEQILPGATEPQAEGTTTEGTVSGEGAVSSDNASDRPASKRQKDRSAKVGESKSEKPARADGKKGKGEGEQGTVWVSSGDFVRPVTVIVKGTDGSMTAVASDELTEDDRIVTGEMQVAAAKDEVNNPFGPPKFPRRTSGSGPASGRNR